MRCLVDRQNGKYRGTEKENLIKLLDMFQSFKLNRGVTQSKRYVTFYCILFFQKSSIILKKRVIWICLFTFSVTPPTLLHSVFTQNFQRPGLLWLRVNETGFTPLGDPMPKFFSGSDLVFFCRGWGGYLQDSFISIIHSIMISLLHTSK